MKPGDIVQVIEDRPEIHCYYLGEQRVTLLEGFVGLLVSRDIRCATIALSDEVVISCPLQALKVIDEELPERDHTGIPNNWADVIQRYKIVLSPEQLRRQASAS